jgi:1-hydroxycarotenoid 3,4-desaturase
MGVQGARVVIIGAGIGGLAAALRLSHAGCAVTVVEAQSGPGGKMRTIPSVAGPVDAGPTVLSMRPVFDALFADVNENLSDHLDLEPLSTLARHYWDDGTTFDLMADPQATMANIETVFGAGSAQDYAAFLARTSRLFDAFDRPMMGAAKPSQSALTAQVLRSPRLLWDMAPHLSLAGLLRSRFRDPRLRQLFGRYATYVGGSPYLSPALLALVSQAEQRGVWAVKGGMHRLAQVIESLARKRGATFTYDTRVQRIELQGGRVGGIATTAGRIPADILLFNCDPRALVQGNLGQAGKQALDQTAVEPRSLSAYVHAFAATPTGPALSHHTVFFGHDPRAEFDALARGQRPTDATLYLCAQDRTDDRIPTGPERFEIIMNGPPDQGTRAETEKDIADCQTQVFSRLRAFGLSFDPQPGRAALTTPQGFARLFPASQGSLYGRSPHGLTAGLKRPTARTAVAGLYLVGGGAHPGAGVPMATLSARHAAAAILTDLALPSTSPRTVTRGGMSTGSAMTGRKPSPS